MSYIASYDRKAIATIIEPLKLLNLAKLNSINWSKITLKIPVPYRVQLDQYSIEVIRNVNGKAICELVGEKGTINWPLSMLPSEVKERIDYRLMLQQ